ncbi:hypothetical protein DICVIV_13825, partial [Dictyocaulus viviparus]
MIVASGNSSRHVKALAEHIIKNLKPYDKAEVEGIDKGGTTKIGDPCFKDKARSILPIENIKQNISGIKRILEKMVSFDNKKSGAII